MCVTAINVHEINLSPYPKQKLLALRRTHTHTHMHTPNGRFRRAETVSATIAAQTVK